MWLIYSAVPWQGEVWDKVTCLRYEANISFFFLIAFQSIQVIINLQKIINNNQIISSLPPFTFCHVFLLLLLLLLLFSFLSLFLAFFFFFFFFFFFRFEKRPLLQRVYNLNKKIQPVNFQLLEANKMYPITLGSQYTLTTRTYNKNKTNALYWLNINQPVCFICQLVKVSGYIWLLVWRNEWNVIK